MQVPLAPHPHQHLLAFQLSDDSHSNWATWNLTVIFICITLMAGEVLSTFFFKCLLVICISSFLAGHNRICLFLLYWPLLLVIFFSWRFFLHLCFTSSLIFPYDLWKAGSQLTLIYCTNKVLRQSRSKKKSNNTVSEITSDSFLTSIVPKAIWITMNQPGPNEELSNARFKVFL